MRVGHGCRCICLGMDVYVDAITFMVSTWTQALRCIHTYMSCTYTNIHAYIHIHTYIYTHIHTHTHTYMHTYTPALAGLFPTLQAVIMLPLANVVVKRSGTRTDFVCMHICMYIHICTYTYMYVYILSCCRWPTSWSNVQERVLILYVCIYVCMCMYVCMHACMCKYIYTCVRVRLCACMHMHIHM
jgi:hypothetical protein